ncbi:YcxB family protein [Bacillus sp. P14.5]|uniref:YcxB family protein n=1 Tax=Bacillus sp. P14.5 TaxID=1983400 RepID=UPI000DEA7EBB|nr:YcxB family protein [Bacillus sp. P14.5]
MEQENSTIAGDSLTVSGTISKDDFINHNRYHIKKFNRIVLLSGFVTFLAIFIIGTWSINQDLWDWTFAIILGLIFATVISSVLLVFAKVFTKFRAAKEYKSDQLLKNEITYIFSSDEIQQKIRKSTNYLEWNDILKVREHPDMFQMYISRNKAILLPNSYFSSKADKEKLKQLISENVSKEKVKFL